MDGGTTARSRAVAIFGPTSSGKTAASLDLAEELARNGKRPVVLNADSRQVYRGMDIGTSKTLHSQMRGIEHRLLDLSTPDRPVTLERYSKLAGEDLGELAKDPRVVPIVVGGTGTYVKAVIDNWDLGGSTATRRALERDFPRDQTEDAFGILERIDPMAARKTHPKNYEAVLNALARRMASGTEGGTTTNPFTFSVFCMKRDYGDIKRRIERALQSQLDAGLLEEVSELAKRYALVEECRRKGTAAENVVLRTHGYREFIEYSVARSRPLRSLSRSDIESVRSAILDHIWAYARRQRGWYPKLRHRALVPTPEGVRAAGRSILRLSIETS